LCKQVEGVGFPFQVESLEDGVDDAIHALDIDKADHRPGPPSYFDEAASITLVVRSLRHKCRGKAKKDNNSGRSCCDGAIALVDLSSVTAI
jgi:hypothetical protein